MKFEHDVTFDRDRKRPTRAHVVFTDEEGGKHDVVAEAQHPEVGVYYGSGLSRRRLDDRVVHYAWNSRDDADLAEVESNAVSLDQLMRFELGG